LPFSNIATHLYVSLIFGGLVSAVIWYFWPTTVEQRPTPIGDDTFSRLTRWTYARDPRSNAFPSSHATTALICSYYLAHAYPPFAIIVWSLCIFIVSATLFIKQHHLIDLISGGILALIAILFSILVMIY
jgi:membrane-associated phospholipid phosphatase